MVISPARPKIRVITFFGWPLPAFACISTNLQMSLGLFWLM